MCTLAKDDSDAFDIRSKAFTWHHVSMDGDSMGQQWAGSLHSQRREIQFLASPCWPHASTGSDALNSATVSFRWDITQASPGHSRSCGWSSRREGRMTRSVEVQLFQHLPHLHLHSKEFVASATLRDQRPFARRIAWTHAMSLGRRRSGSSSFDFLTKANSSSMNAFRFFACF